MKIGIIGSGYIGGALTRRFSAAGHQVSVANSRGPASLADLAHETGAHAASIDEVTCGNQVIVVAVPLSKIDDLPPGLWPSRPPTPSLSTPATTILNSAMAASRPSRRVWWKAAGSSSGSGGLSSRCSTASSPRICRKVGSLRGQQARIALAVAGDDPKAKAAVMGLVDGIGFDAVDAGTIHETWRQQPGSPGYCKDYDVTGVRQALAAAHSERAPGVACDAKQLGHVRSARLRS